MPWHYDPEAGIFRPPHGLGHPSYSHAHHTNTSGSGSHGPSLQTLHPPNDCTHCHAYKVHVMFACLQGDDALERDWTGKTPENTERLGDRYSPDFSELSQARAQLRRYIQERDDAIELNAHYRNEVVSLEGRLREAKDRLLALEIAYGDETQLRDVESSGEESRYDGLPTMEAEQNDEFEDDLDRSNDNSPDADLGMDELWTVDPSINQDEASDDFDTFQQIHLMSLGGECTPWEDDSSSDAQQEIPQNPINSTLGMYCTDSSSDFPSPSSSSSSLSASDWVGDQSDDDSSPPTKPTSSDKDLHQTLKLMAAAHEVGNTTALAKVKKLIIQAEKTPRHDRTIAQNYILLNWRSPGSSSSRNNNCPNSASAQPARPIPPSSQGPEIFVDASPLGIGFVFKTQWLAWTFKKTSKIPLGSDGRVVMSWAELLAVEVGLRALITAGYRSTNITIRSDNTGVINALTKRTWCQQYGIEEMLQNILDLCGEYGIQLRPSWISTKMNSADKPSRGKLPPWSLAFKFPPKLPRRLVGLLKLAAPPKVNEG